jgi:sigma-B regulation protein RsbU (phosphoserine phosphatase)
LDTLKRDGLGIASYCKYCDEIGGDYFDFLNISGLPPTATVIAVGDVAGHGVAAAMLMNTARGILPSRCQ